VDRPAAVSGSEECVGAWSTDAVPARSLARLPQSGRAADAAVPRVHATHELDWRRLDDRVKVSVDGQTRQFHAGHYQ